MTTIWKFSIPVKDRIKLDMPKGAKILTVQTQYPDASLWAIVDSEVQTEQRYFELYGTGHDMHEPRAGVRQYIGTFQMREGGLVFHLFEIRDRPTIPQLQPY